MDDQADGEGMHGKRVESAALIPSQAGTLQLPEVRVHWWDLDSDSEKVAIISAQALTIGAGTATNTTIPNTAGITTAPNNSAPTAADKTRDAIGTPAPAINTTTAVQRWWYFITAALLLGWLSTLWLYWRLRRSVGKLPATADTSKRTDTSAPHLQAAIAACQQHQASAAHAALSQWVRHQFPQTPTLAQWLEQLRGDANTAALRAAVEALDRCNYGATAHYSEWDGKTLAQELMRLCKKGEVKAASTSKLVLLYPAH